MQENTVKRKTDLCLLKSFYGELLTEKERLTADLFLDEDLSLAEIAEETGISRQAVHDTLNRSFQKLEEYESRLCLCGRFIRMEKGLNELRQLLQHVEPDERSREEMKKARSLLDEMIAYQEQ